MSKEIIKPAKLEVVTSEQASLLEQLKAYDLAEEISAKHRKGYAYLKGRIANALKECADSKTFISLLEATFTANKVRWIQYCMNFAEAVDSRKNAPVRFLSDDRLLTAGAISEKEKEQVADAVVEVTGDKGIKQTILDWKKKTAPKPPPMDAVRAEQEHQKNIESAFDTARANLSLLMEFRDVDFVLASKALRLELKALCVRYGKRVAATKKLKTKTT